MPKLLFVGQLWLGCCGRSLCGALARQQGIIVEEVAKDALIPNWNPRPLRLIRRGMLPILTRMLRDAILSKVDTFKPDLVVVYKGNYIDRSVINALRDRSCPTVNVYPDVSPLAQGPVIRETLGHYDLVLSTKPWHPDRWRDLFHFSNRCRFVPQGYDPYVHLRQPAARKPRYDVCLVATQRAEYLRLMQGLARDGRLARRRVLICGNGWDGRLDPLPARWELRGPVTGQSYTETVLQAKLSIAPVTREIVVDGRKYPGDEDTTRTYELPAMGAALVHRRTDFVQTLFDESEVPLYDAADDLAETLERYLDDDVATRNLAAAAHARAVPRDSMDSRAQRMLSVLKEEGLLA